MASKRVWIKLVRVALLAAFATFGVSGIALADHVGHKDVVMVHPAECELADPSLALFIPPEVLGAECLPVVLEAAKAELDARVLTQTDIEELGLVGLVDARTLSFEAVSDIGLELTEREIDAGLLGPATILELGLAGYTAAFDYGNMAENEIDAGFLPSPAAPIVVDSRLFFQQYSDAIASVERVLNEEFAAPVFWWPYFAATDMPRDELEDPESAPLIDSRLFFKQYSDAIASVERVLNAEFASQAMVDNVDSRLFFKQYSDAIASVERVLNAEFASQAMVANVDSRLFFKQYSDAIASVERVLNAEFASQAMVDDVDSRLFFRQYSAAIESVERGYTADFYSEDSLKRFEQYLDAAETDGE